MYYLIKAIIFVIVCHYNNVINLFRHIFYHDCNRNCDIITKSDKKLFLRFITMLTKTIPKPGSMNSHRPWKINRHMVPFYMSCAPCDIKYDYIIKLETSDQDTR